MGSLNRRPGREKNQFLRELEEYEQNKIDEHCERYQLYEDCEDNYECDACDEYDEYDEYDDDDTQNCDDDFCNNEDMFSPGDHVKTKDGIIFIKTSQHAFINIITGAHYNYLPGTTSRKVF